MNNRLMTPWTHKPPKQSRCKHKQGRYCFCNAHNRLLVAFLLIVLINVLCPDNVTVAFAITLISLANAARIPFDKKTAASLLVGGGVFLVTPLPFLFQNATDYVTWFDISVNTNVLHVIFIYLKLLVSGSWLYWALAHTTKQEILWALITLQIPPSLVAVFFLVWKNIATLADTAQEMSKSLDTRLRMIGKKRRHVTPLQGLRMYAHGIITLFSVAHDSMNEKMVSMKYRGIKNADDIVTVIRFRQQLSASCTRAVSNNTDNAYHHQSNQHTIMRKTIDSRANVFTHVVISTLVVLLLLEYCHC